MLQIIQQLYQPVQPTVSNTSDVLYNEMKPTPHLQSWIYCYWQLKTTAALSEPFSYKVVADGCIDIFFELDNPASNFVMGFSNAYTEFTLPQAFNYIGVRFLPTSFPHLFNVNAAELTNRFEHLQQLIPHTSKFIAENFHAGLSKEQVRQQLDQYFSHMVDAADSRIDSRLYDALEVILKQQGDIKLENSIETGISHRQLRRLFEFYIGDSIKTFSKVVRFQNLLHTKPTDESLRRNKIFFESGYYDQSHFIKEFKTLFGTTPSKAFKPDEQ